MPRSAWQRDKTVGVAAAQRRRYRQGHTRAWHCECARASRSENPVRWLIGRACEHGVVALPFRVQVGLMQGGVTQPCVAGSPVVHTRRATFRAVGATKPQCISLFL